MKRIVYNEKNIPSFLSKYENIEEKIEEYDNNILEVERKIDFYGKISVLYDKYNKNKTLGNFLKMKKLIQKYSSKVSIYKQVDDIANLYKRAGDTLFNNIEQTIEKNKIRIKLDKVGEDAEVFKNLYFNYTNTIQQEVDEFKKENYNQDIPDYKISEFNQNLVSLLNKLISEGLDSGSKEKIEINSLKAYIQKGIPDFFIKLPNQEDPSDDVFITFNKEVERVKGVVKQRLSDNFKVSKDIDSSLDNRSDPGLIVSKLTINVNDLYTNRIALFKSEIIPSKMKHLEYLIRNYNNYDKILTVSVKNNFLNLINLISVSTFDFSNMKNPEIFYEKTLGIEKNKSFIIKCIESGVQNIKDNYFISLNELNNYYEYKIQNTKEELLDDIINKRNTFYRKETFKIKLDQLESGRERVKLINDFDNKIENIKDDNGFKEIISKELTCSSIPGTDGGENFNENELVNKYKKEANSIFNKFENILTKINPGINREDFSELTTELKNLYDEMKKLYEKLKKLKLKLPLKKKEIDKILDNASDDDNEKGIKQKLSFFSDSFEKIRKFSKEKNFIFNFDEEWIYKQEVYNVIEKILINTNKKFGRNPNFSKENIPNFLNLEELVKNKNFDFVNNIIPQNLNEEDKYKVLMLLYENILKLFNSYKENIRKGDVKKNAVMAQYYEYLLFLITEYINSLKLTEIEIKKIENKRLSGEEADFGTDDEIISVLDQAPDSSENDRKISNEEADFDVDDEIISAPDQALISTKEKVFNYFTPYFSKILEIMNNKIKKDYGKELTRTYFTENEIITIFKFRGNFNVKFCNDFYKFELFKNLTKEDIINNFIYGMSELLENDFYNLQMTNTIVTLLTSLYNNLDKCDKVLKTKIEISYEKLFKDKIRKILPDSKELGNIDLNKLNNYDNLTMQDKNTLLTNFLFLGEDTDQKKIRILEILKDRKDEVLNDSQGDLNKYLLIFFNLIDDLVVYLSLIYFIIKDNEKLETEKIKQKDANKSYIERMIFYRNQLLNELKKEKSNKQEMENLKKILKELGQNINKKQDFLDTPEGDKFLKNAFKNLNIVTDFDSIPDSQEGDLSIILQIINNFLRTKGIVEINIDKILFLESTDRILREKNSYTCRFFTKIFSIQGNGLPPKENLDYYNNLLEELTLYINNILSSSKYNEETNKYLENLKLIIQNCVLYYNNPNNENIKDIELIFGKDVSSSENTKTFPSSNDSGDKNIQYSREENFNQIVNIINNFIKSLEDIEISEVDYSDIYFDENEKISKCDYITNLFFKNISSETKYGPKEKLQKYIYILGKFKNFILKYLYNDINKFQKTYFESLLSLLNKCYTRVNSSLESKNKDEIESKEKNIFGNFTKMNFKDIKRRSYKTYSFDKYLEHSQKLKKLSVFIRNEEENKKYFIASYVRYEILKQMITIYSSENKLLKDEIDIIKKQNYDTTEIKRQISDDEKNFERLNNILINNKDFLNERKQKAEAEETAILAEKQKIEQEKLQKDRYLEELLYIKQELERLNNIPTPPGMSVDDKKLMNKLTTDKNRILPEYIKLGGKLSDI